MSYHEHAILLYSQISLPFKCEPPPFTRELSIAHHTHALFANQTAPSHLCQSGRLSVCHAYVAKCDFWAQPHIPKSVLSQYILPFHLSVFGLRSILLWVNMTGEYSVEQPFSLQTEGCICRCSRTGECLTRSTISGVSTYQINHHVSHHCGERPEHSELYSGR